MVPGDRKGEGAMAETLYGDRQQADVQLDRPAPGALPPVLARAAKARSLGLAASLRTALEERRGFVLLPFAAIAGLVVAANLPVEPQASLLIAVAALPAL